VLQHREIGAERQRRDNHVRTVGVRVRLVP
jgi:hypothetical protein